MKPRILEISIDRLVLGGFAAEDGARIRVSIERELARLFAEQGLSEGLTEGVSIARLSGGEIGVESGVHAEPAGTHIARAIYGAMKR